MKVLITGGAGYIGATIASACLDAGMAPVILDDLSTGTAHHVRGRIFYQGDIADGELVDLIFQRHQPACVIHCAGMSSVPESFIAPARCFEANVAKSAQFVAHLLRQNGCTRLVYSSSAAVYGSTDEVFVDERVAPSPRSPYARTKVLMEGILATAMHDCGLNVVSFRYFNPVGVDPQMRTGKGRTSPRQVVDELVQADRQRRPFKLTGTHWPTIDGTAVRDYVHVWDLAHAHLAAIQHLGKVSDGPGSFEVINLGTGVATTVLQLLDTFRHITGRAVQVQYEDARPGDIAGVVNRSTRARTLLGWMPSRTLEHALSDAMAWHDRRDGMCPDTTSGADG